MTTRTKPRGRRGTSRGRGQTEGMTTVDIDELRQRIDAGTYDTEAGFDADLLRTDLGSRNPAPDPSQGRGAASGGDFRTASKEDFDAELRRLGVRPRSH